jgi:putative flavoprotein involved in K+ transport
MSAPLICEAHMNHERISEHVQVAVIGAGQAGLSVGYCLARLGLTFVILEANARVGDSWRQRWDSMRLFTPAKYDGLIGMPFPAPAFSFPTKDEMADYVESYARRFDLPVRTSTKVDRLWRDDSRYVVEAAGRRVFADHVVVAMASYQGGRLPAFAKDVDPRITQLHSVEYRNRRQLQPGDALIVGAANSGADIAIDVAASHRTWLAGRHPGHVPFHIDRVSARFIMPILFRVVFHRILTTDTPMGRRARQSMISKGLPLIRVKPDDLTRAGVERTPRVVGVQDGKPSLEDGRVMDVANVIWCTGYDSGLSWIDLPVHGRDGEPIQERGIVPDEPGLYFVGQHFMYSASSTMIHGIERDARRVANTIAARVKSTAPQSSEAPARGARTSRADGRVTARVGGPS